LVLSFTNLTTIKNAHHVMIGILRQSTRSVRFG
jgi:hypothetical protein